MFELQTVTPKVNKKLEIWTVNPVNAK